MAKPVIGVASIMQECNSFSTDRARMASFETQGLYRGAEVLEKLSGTNTEIAGATEALRGLGATPKGLIRAFALSGPLLLTETFDELSGLLFDSMHGGSALDGLVLSLHGGMATEEIDDADARLAAVARRAVGPEVPIAVSLDLHANVTQSLLDSVDIVAGYHTYPHVDMAHTGARAARLLFDTLEGRLQPEMALVRRAMIVPAETSQTTSGPVGMLSEEARRSETGGVVDTSIFTAQPWLDVHDLGFSAIVVANGDRSRAHTVAERLAALAWDLRRDLDVPLVTPEEAIAEVRRRRDRPVLLCESSDSPTGGAAGDSPAMIRVLLSVGRGLTAFTTVVDRQAVAACYAAGAGATVSLDVGASVERRFDAPVHVDGEVVTLRAGTTKLTGPAFRGIELSMGRTAVVRAGDLYVLLAEIGPYTFDPVFYRAVGLEPAKADIVIVRSATLFRAGFADVITGPPLFLDLPGVTTPRFARLPYKRVTRPLYPLDD